MAEEFLRPEQIWQAVAAYVAAAHRACAAAVSPPARLMPCGTGLALARTGVSPA